MGNCHGDVPEGSVTKIRASMFKPLMAQPPITSNFNYTATKEPTVAYTNTGPPSTTTVKTTPYREPPQSDNYYEPRVQTAYPQQPKSSPQPSPLSTFLPKSIPAGNNQQRDTATDQYRNDTRDNTLVVFSPYSRDNPTFSTPKEPETGGIRRENTGKKEWARDEDTAAGRMVIPAERTVTGTTTPAPLKSSLVPKRFESQVEPPSDDRTNRFAQPTSTKIQMKVPEYNQNKDPEIRNIQESSIHSSKNLSERASIMSRASHGNAPIVRPPLQLYDDRASVFVKKASYLPKERSSIKNSQYYTGQAREDRRSGSVKQWGVFDKSEFRKSGENKENWGSTLKDNEDPITKLSTIKLPEPPAPKAPTILAKCGKMLPESEAVKVSRDEIQFRPYPLLSSEKESGPYQISDGGTYIGQTKDIYMHGRGRWVGTKGEVLEGYFQDGFLHGEGRLISETGDVYQGDWVQGKKCGKGMLHLLSGYLYRGEWVDDVQQGEGFEREKDGNTYKGTFENGVRSGTGTYKSVDPDDEFTYEGEFTMGMMEGQGVLTRPEGELYEGTFKANKYHGEGYIKDDDGEYRGEFVQGRKHGRGQQNYTDTQEIYVGTFKFGRPDGKGSLTKKNGQTVQGEWRNGEMISTDNRNSARG